VFTGFDYNTSDLYRWDPATDQLTRLTHDEESESCPVVSPDGQAVYYISESQGETLLKRLSLDNLGSPVGSPQTVHFQAGRKAPPLPEGHLAFITAGKDGLYFTSDRDHRMFNLFRIGWDGKNLVQLTRSYVDILSAAPSPDGSIFYAGIYHKFTVDLWRLESIHLEHIPSPSADLTFLCNSFSGASTLLAQDARPSPTPDLEEDALASPPPIPHGYSMGLSEDMDPVRRRALRKLDQPKPTHPPAAPPQLKVKEATNLVHLQWVESDEKDETDQYKVYRATSELGPFQCLGSTNILKRHRYVDYNVENGKTYYYYVTALNEIGESVPSETVQALPSFTQTTKPYRFRMSPDLVLLLAGYDSAYGFMGGGALSLSDYLGNNRISFMGERVPGNQTGIQLDYEYAKYRTTVDFNYFYYNDFYSLLDINSGNILDQYRDKDKGANLMFTYPFTLYTRLEYGIGTERFQGMSSTLRFSEGISNHFFSPSNGQDNANFYRLSLVMDKRRGRRFWADGGWGGSLTYVQAPSILDSTVSFRNYLVEGEWYVDFKPLQRLVWANRVVGFHSEGPQPQTYFLGPDRPFQTFFTTFRGFGSADYFGRNLLLYNVELRLPMVSGLNTPLHPFNFMLLKDIELAVFSDTGIVADRISGFSTHRLLNSIGTGIRFYNFMFQRSLVQLRFDVAWRTDPGHHPPDFTFNLVPSF